MEKMKGQLIAKYKDGAERDLILAELKNAGFLCRNTSIGFDEMNVKERDWYFYKLPFVVDFSERVFFATNVTCLAAASSSESGRKMFVDADEMIAIIRGEFRSTGSSLKFV